MSEKVALVTGSALRIGADICTFLLKKSWNIALHYNKSETEAIELAKQLINFGNIIIYQADLTDQQQVENLFTTVKADFGQIDLIINNAAFHQKTTLDNIELAQLNRDFSLHCFAPLLLAQKMLLNDFSGNIINILDCDNFNNQADFLSYNLSKITLHEITKKLAIALAPKIRVNSVALGPIMFKAGQSLKVFEQLQKNTPLNHKITTEDLGQVIDFILSANAITGNCIFLDNGKHLL